MACPAGPQARDQRAIAPGFGLKIVARRGRVVRSHQGERSSGVRSRAVSSSLAGHRQTSTRTMRNITAINDHNNSLHVWRNTHSDFAVDLIWRNNGRWSGWQKSWNRSPTLRQLVAVNESDNGLSLWGVGIDHTVYRTRRSKGQWSAWDKNWNFAPKLQRVVAVIDQQTKGNPSYVWGIGTDNAVHHTSLTFVSLPPVPGSPLVQNANWSTWVRDWANAPKLQDIFAVTSGGRIFVWGIGTNNTVHLNWHDSTKWSGWLPPSLWNSPPPLRTVFALIDPGIPFAAAYDTNKGIDVWGIGPDGAVHHTFWHRGVWSNWELNWNNAPKLNSITAVKDANGSLHVFGIGVDNTVYLIWRDGTKWSGWLKGWNNAPKLQSITPINDANNSLHVFGIGTDNLVYLIWRNNGKWSSWMKDWK